MAISYCSTNRLATHSRSIDATARGITTVANNVSMATKMSGTANSPASLSREHGMFQFSTSTSS